MQLQGTGSNARCMIVLHLKLIVMVAQVAELWQRSFRLVEVGQAAVEKARSWTEAANAATLLSLLCSAL